MFRPLRFLIKNCQYYFSTFQRVFSVLTIDYTATSICCVGRTAVIGQQCCTWERVCACVLRAEKHGGQPEFKYARCVCPVVPALICTSGMQESNTLRTSNIYNGHHIHFFFHFHFRQKLQSRVLLWRPICRFPKEIYLRHKSKNLKKN